MKRAHIKDLNKHIDDEVKISGWIQTMRNQGSIHFFIVRDMTGLVQVVVSAPNKELKGIIDQLTLESVVTIKGVVKGEKQAPNGYEIKVESISILSLADSGLPIPVIEKGSSEVSQNKRLDWRWLDLRKPEKHLLFQVWTAMEQAFVNYCTQNNYTRIHSPKFMSTPSESGAELFEVDYFDKKAYLAQSPQFYKQMGMAAGFERVFEMGPVFRANPSFTSRHDTEFTGYDIEISFIESHQDVIAEEESFIIAMLKAVDELYGQQIETEYNRKLIIPERPFPQVTMKEAKEILGKLNVPSEKEGDLSPEEERKLSEHIKREKGHEFVFVTEYPIEVRPFYHMRFEDRPNITKSFDLLWNGLEITTGAQREHRYNILLNQAKEKGFRLEPLQHYLNFFKYGCPPHGGLGFGPSRFLMKIFNLNNVREVTYLYRGVNRLTP